MAETNKKRLVKMLKDEKFRKQKRNIVNLKKGEVKKKSVLLFMVKMLLALEFTGPKTAQTFS